MKKKSEETRVVKTIPVKSSHQVERAIKLFIAKTRKNRNINLTIEERPISADGKMVVEFLGETIHHIKLPFSKKRWVPEKLTVVKSIKDIQFLQEIICDTEDRLEERFGKKFAVKLVSLTMHEADGKYLLILLATKVCRKKKK